MKKIIVPIAAGVAAVAGAAARLSFWCGGTGNGTDRGKSEEKQGHCIE